MEKRLKISQKIAFLSLFYRKSCFLQQLSLSQDFADAGMLPGIMRAPSHVENVGGKQVTPEGQAQKGNFLTIFGRIFWSFPKVFQILCWDFRETGAVDFQNAGFWRLRAPETSIWAPEGAFGPQKAIFPLFFHDFFHIFGR